MRTADVLIRRRLADWEELEDLVARGPRNRYEAGRLGLLYRRASSDLAAARRDFPLDPVTMQLERLVAAAHALVFRGRSPVLLDLGHLLVREFPGAVKALRMEILTAAAVLVVTGVVFVFLALVVPGSVMPFLPAGMETRIQDVAELERAGHPAPWVEIPLEERPWAALDITTNNVTVSLVCFAGGATLGLLTLHVLAFNGAFLGLIVGACARAGILGSLGEFVAAHVLLELSVIVVTAGAGLGVGRAFLLPGAAPRLASTVRAARLAVSAALGGAALLVVSGLVEGHVSPSGVSVATKVLVGLGLFGGFWVLVALAPDPTGGAGPGAPLGERDRVP